MKIRRSALALGGAAALIFSTIASAQSEPQPRKLTDAEKKEIVLIQKMVDDAAAGKGTMPNDLSLTWLYQDSLKALANKQYLPFNFTIDPSKVSGGKLTLYWRVVSTDPPPADAAKKDPKKKDSEYPYEDINTLTVESGKPGPMRVSRSFTVLPGNYDIFIVAKEPTPQKVAKNAPPLKTSLIKQSVVVPDFWNGEFNTSSVIVAERIDPLPVAPTPQQQSERPYALGNMELVPAPSTKFAKKGELSTFLLIYNAKTDAANKPDVTVEYNFYVKEAGEEKFFNKTNPQNLNAQTLPPEFDFAQGHQLQSGQAVPLASFPEGEYRLEIKITDKLANKTLTRNVPFTVSGS